MVYYRNIRRKEDIMPFIKEREDTNRMVKCDARCPANAIWRASFLAGPLFFCGHHLRELNRNPNPIQRVALEIIHR